MPDDLRGLIKVFEERSVLKRVKEKVKVDLELAEIVRRVFRKGGPALLFENVEGFRMPVLANIFGTEDRVLMALGVDSYEPIMERVKKLLELPRRLKAKSIVEAFKVYRSVKPKLVSKAPCKEKVYLDEEVKLTRLPAIRSWPKEAGRFITYPLVFTRDPEDGSRNVGVYRMQVFDERTAGIHWQVHKHGALHLSKAGGKPLEVAVALGGDPALMLTAAMPLPKLVDEVLMAGALKGSPVKLVKCEAVDLEVPAGAEVVLEGYVDPSEVRVEGPFGDHTGYYTPPRPCSVFRVKCMTMRGDAIYPAWVEGPPPTEGAVLQSVFERIARPLLRALMPEVVDIHFPPEACYHGLCIVSIEKRYPGHAKRVMMGLWGLEPFSLVKAIIVVDADVDVRDLSKVIWAVATRVDPARDIVVIERAPVDELDHASPILGLGSRIGIDATRKMREEAGRDMPEELEVDEEVARRVDELWPRLGL